MPGYGRTVLVQTGIPINVQASSDPKFPMIGQTIAWSTVTPLASQYTDQSGLTLQPGALLIRFGQVMVPVLTGQYAGQWGPYDPAATDGRQNDPAVGKALIVNESVVKGGLFGLTTYNDAIFTGLAGGTVYIDRVIQAGTGTASLANGPTWAKLFAALPTLVPFQL